MEAVRIKFIDFWPGFNCFNNEFTKILSKKYKVEISDDPDYLIYSVFGDEHLEYDCIRILYAGENQRPDFNICDYAIGYDYMEFGDRYTRFPLYLLYKEDFDLALEKHRFTLKDIEHKDRFCNFIYSNGMTHPNRDLFFKLLDNVKTVDSGGRHLNNIGELVDNKLSFQSKYRFSIAFENTETIGYTTEKLIQALAAKTVPIYWGNPNIHKEFNTKAFINCYEYENFEKIIDKVMEIESSEDEFIKILSEPLIKDKEDFYDKETNKLLDFFENIFSQEKMYAHRRDLYCRGKIYENNLKFKNDIIKEFKRVFGI